MFLGEEFSGPSVVFNALHISVDVHQALDKAPSSASFDDINSIACSC